MFALNALPYFPDGSEVNGGQTRGFAVSHVTWVTVERFFFVFCEMHTMTLFKLLYWGKIEIEKYQKKNNDKE